MSAIAISLASLCEKAGNPGNQDNLWICPDLSRSGSPASNDDEVYPLSSYGAVMAVANPHYPHAQGDMASRVVIDTIYSCFTFIPARVTRNDSSIREFLANAIMTADNALRDLRGEDDDYAEASCDICVAWLVKGRLFVAWSGDIRAYIYNPTNCLSTLTHDYSHGPDENGLLQFDIHTYPVHRDDMIMLCSNDVAQSLDEVTINKLLSRTPSLVESLDMLWNRLQNNGGVDDATIALMRVASAPALPRAEPEGWNALYGHRVPPQEGSALPPPCQFPQDNASEITADGVGAAADEDEGDDNVVSLRSIVLGALVAILLVCAGIGIWYTNFRSDGTEDIASTGSDTIINPDIFAIAALVPLDSIAVAASPVDTVKTDTIGSVAPATATVPSSASYYNTDYPDSYPTVDDDNSESPETEIVEQSSPKAPRTLDPHTNFDPNSGDPATNR